MQDTFEVILVRNGEDNWEGLRVDNLDWCFSNFSN